MLSEVTEITTDGDCAGDRLFRPYGHLPVLEVGKEAGGGDSGPSPGAPTGHHRPYPRAPPRQGKGKRVVVEFAKGGAGIKPPPNNPLEDHCHQRHSVIQFEACINNEVNCL